MTAFAAWIGRLAAAFAAVLAVVWFVEAMPYSADKAEMLSLECQLTAFETLPIIPAIAETHACDRRFVEWNERLTNRALIATGAAVVLLLLTAMLPRPAPAPLPTQQRPAPLSFAELARRTSHEQWDHKRLTGRDLPEAEARRRVEWRHDQGLHREPPP